MFNLNKNKTNEHISRLFFIRTYQDRVTKENPPELKCSVTLLKFRVISQRPPVQNMVQTTEPVRKHLHAYISHHAKLYIRAMINRFVTVSIDKIETDWTWPTISSKSCESARYTPIHNIFLVCFINPSRMGVWPVARASVPQSRFISRTPLTVIHRLDPEAWGHADTPTPPHPPHYIITHQYVWSNDHPPSHITQRREVFRVVCGCLYA